MSSLIWNPPHLFQENRRNDPTAMIPLKNNEGLFYSQYHSLLYQIGNIDQKKKTVQIKRGMTVSTKYAFNKVFQSYLSNSSCKSLVI